MKTNHRDKQFAARRVDQSLHSRKAAGDVFRRRYLDGAIKRLLKNYEQKEINPNPPSPESDRPAETSGADQAGET